MLFLDKIKTIFDKNKLIPDTINSVEDVNLIYFIANSISDLYNQLNSDVNLNLILFFKIKDVTSSKNCTITNLNTFLDRIKERDSIIGYEFLISHNSLYSGKNKVMILVKVYNDKNIVIEYQNDFDYELIKHYINELKEKIENFYNKSLDIYFIEKEDNSFNVDSLVDLGILNSFEFSQIQYKTVNNLTQDEINSNIIKIFNEYKKNIIDINKKIFYEMHNILVGTDYNIWEYDGFKKIVDINLLPSNFFHLSNNEKRSILFLDDNLDNYVDFWDKFNVKKPFWKLDCIKDDIIITNVVIDDKFKLISIEFNGFCQFFNAFIELKYDDNFEINTFLPS